MKDMYSPTGWENAVDCGNALGNKYPFTLKKTAPATQQAGYAEVIECGNSYAKVKLKGEAFGSTRVGDIFYTALQQDEPVGEVVSASCDHATVRWLHQTSSVGGGDPRNSRAWPKVSGVSRDEGHSRALLVFFAAEPTDDEMRAVHDTLAASPTPPVEQAAPKAAPGEQNTVPAEWLEQAYREGWAACRDAETIGEEAEDWAFGNSTANSRMIDAQQAAPKQEAQEPVAYVEVSQSDAEVSMTWGPEPAGFNLPTGRYALYTSPQPAQGFRRGQAAAKQEG